jgi:diguanylate cyclase (GGDEF)-like protein
VVDVEVTSHALTFGGRRARLVLVEDVTERRRLEAELTHQAYHDALTGLANRARFSERVGVALARPGRRPEEVAVLFLDVDHFKAVNDSLGHEAGDVLLRAVAQRLLEATRGSDTVARLGGDEFAVLLENVRTDHDAVIVAERILAAMRPGVALGRPDAEGDGARAVRVGTSVGIARARGGEEADALLRHADLAMYTAKRDGRGRFALFEPAMHAAAVERLELDADLRASLERLEAAPSRASDGGDGHDFHLVYQPVVELATGRVVAAEALLRWRHAQRGLVPPAVFIPVAEETGLIGSLGRWVLEAACRQAAAWGDRGPVVSVNLSGRQLDDPALVAGVEGALAAAGLAPRRLTLEITESVVMRRTDATLERLRALKALGVRLAIDDFGTGYSSLSYLQRFPVDVLKIDKSFVDGVASEAHDAALARTIVALGTTLGLRTVAEGIETEDQQAALLALGCTYGQGYFFARPLPAGAFGALVRAAPAPEIRDPAFAA